MHKPYANMNREELIDEVMDVTKSTITYDDDWTALEKLLTFVPTEKLRGFLPEEDPAEEKESWQDELVDHIDTATSKIDTSNWKQGELGVGKSAPIIGITELPTLRTLDMTYKNLSEIAKKNLLLDEVLADRRGISTKEAMSVLLEENDKAQLPRVYYHSWITGPQGARFKIFKSDHSTEVINETKSRLRYDQDVVKIYVVDGEPEDYDHKKERLEFYDIEENDNE